MGSRSEGVPRPPMPRNRPFVSPTYGISLHRAGDAPNSRFEPRLNASSDSYPTE